MASSTFVKKVLDSDKVFYESVDLYTIFGYPPNRTLEDTIKRLVDDKVLTPLEKGKYFVTTKNPSDFEIAYFLYNPSYVSFETALNYRGILPQFPVQITSATTRRSNKKNVLGKTYSYSHIKKDYFTGYERIGESLVAVPEKALVDQIYFSMKGIKSTLNLDEYDLSNISKGKLQYYSDIFGSSYSMRFLDVVRKRR